MPAELHARYGRSMLVPQHLAGLGIDGDYGVVGVDEVEPSFGQHGTLGNLRAGGKSVAQLPVARVELVERAVIRTKIQRVFYRIVQRRRLHVSDGLEAPKWRAVARVQAIETMVARTHEQTAMNCIDFDLSALVGLTMSPGRRDHGGSVGQV